MMNSSVFQLEPLAVRRASPGALLRSWRWSWAIVWAVASGGCSGSGDSSNTTSVEAAGGVTGGVTSNAGGAAVSPAGAGVGSVGVSVGGAGAVAATDGAGTGTGATGAAPGGGASGSQGGVSAGGAGDAGSVVVNGAGAGGAGSNVSPTTEEYAVPASLLDEDGSQLWLRYSQVSIPGRLAEYQASFTHVVQSGSGATLQAAEDELVTGLGGLTGAQISVAEQPAATGAVVIGTPASSPLIAASPLAARLAAVGEGGYLVEATQVDGQSVVVVAGNTDIGVLYGSFALLRHLQSHLPLAGLALSGSPKIQRRVLNHWDNPDRTVERGYAGRSLWDWGSLPGTLSPRYKDYARANASLGINGAVLNNVNADAQILAAASLDKVKALADVFRPYGIAVYITARYSAPQEVGGLATSDESNAGVKQWWADKATEIYNKIPDFGGFLVKANSEGQPGPKNHADGANMLAAAVAPHGGIVLWRAFVYSDQSPVDRIRQAYEEFKPLDGKFSDGVLIQVKNGPLDFQPREPFSPLFGAMPNTPLALELQITKEYLGEDTHLAYLGPMYEEVLEADTFADGPGSTVAKVIDGSLHGHSKTAISGVANVGTDTNWTGSHFNQANWYVFGRMSWDPQISAAAVAEEWVRQTFSNDPAVVVPVTEMMMGSREALVNYMTPLGLVHIMGTSHHYGPAPWVSDQSRPEWNPVYYHKADAQGIGFDRTPSGSNAVEQYFSPLRETLSSRSGASSAVPDELLLFFHHVGWQDMTSSGRTLWEDLVYHYSLGVDSVGQMRDAWNTVQARVDAKRFKDVSDFLQIQHYEARWWRDACLQYFRTFANLQIPAGYAEPANSLSFYQGLNCPSDVTKPRCSQVYTGEPSPAILP